MRHSEMMREQRKAKKASLDALLGSVQSRDDKNFSEDEARQFDALTEEIRAADARIVELESIEAAEERAAATRVETGESAEARTVGGAQVIDPPVYVEGGGNGQSYFRDLGKVALTGDIAAMGRLTRNGRMVADEKRALGNTNAAGGSGGEMAPPDWLVDRYIKILRAGRVTANLFQHMDIPDGVSSINLPKILTGTTTAIQSTQNSALSQTDLTTGSVQTGFATIGGKQIVSQQLLDQSAIPFDEVILQDLAADYGARVGSQIFVGTGTGSGTTAVVNGLGAATFGTTTTWTQASPTVAGFYGQATKTLSAFLSVRYAPPTCWIMHPRRWYWLMGQTDSTGRPLVNPQGTAFNVLATNDGLPPQGLAGTFLGLPVYIDPNVPTNVGTGTNQDNVYLVKADDLWLFESAPRAEAFRETYADSVGVLFRMYGYVGTMLNRLTASLAVITGTGLVTPTFAS